MIVLLTLIQVVKPWVRSSPEILVPAPGQPAWMSWSQRGVHGKNQEGRWSGWACGGLLHVVSCQTWGVLGPFEILWNHLEHQVFPKLHGPHGISPEKKGLDQAFHQVLGGVLFQSREAQQVWTTVLVTGLWHGGIHPSFFVCIKMWVRNGIQNWIFGGNMGWLWIVYVMLKDC